jgi:hypothetical protein
MPAELWIIRAIVLLDGLALGGYQVYLRKWTVPDERGNPALLDTVETPFQFWFLVAFEAVIGAPKLVGAIGI